MLLGAWKNHLEYLKAAEAFLRYAYEKHDKIFDQSSLLWGHDRKIFLAILT
jgi:hypothetical protein